MKRRLVILAAVLTALSARAEQKNVRLLTNMTDLQLQRTMHMMRASLGVNCDYCHVVDEKNVWHYESDDKKEKRTAREMIAMVIKINKEQFGGRDETSCFTCHRGSVRPVALVSLPQNTPPFPTPQEQRPQLPSLEEIVKKYAAALGNIARLEKPRLTKGTRAGTDGKPIPTEIEQSGARWRIVADYPAGRVEQVVNEEGGWSKDAKGVTPFPSGGAENFREISETFELTLPSEIPADARVTGKDWWGNVETIVVSYRAPDQTRRRLAFNPVTGLLMRRVVIRDTPVGPLPQQTDFDQWHEIGGTTFPYWIRTSLVDPWASSTRQYKFVVLDAKIDPADFAKPK